MKRIYYFMPLLAALLWVLGSCSSEKEINGGDPAGSGNTVVFTIDGGTPATRAAQAGNAVQTAALPREKSITDIYAVTFKNNLFHKAFKAIANGAAGYKFDMLQAGTFDMYLIANPDAALAAQLESGATTTPQQLALLIAGQTPGDDNLATNFLMTAEKKTVTTTASGDTNAGTVKLTRAAARFDVYSRVAGLKMTKITFKNRATTCHIETQAGMSGITLTSNKTYEAAQGLEDYQILAAIYGYENADAGSSTLTLEGTFNGKPIAPHDIVMGGVAVKRNHLYSVIISNEGGNVTPGDPGKLKFDIKVNDWNEDATLEWKDGLLINKNAPGFTVTGTNVTTTPAATGNTPAQNPTEVSVAQYTATNLTVSVTADASSGSKLNPAATLPAGYSITEGAVGNKDGKLTQEFTIKLAENLGVRKSLDFVLVNAFDPSAKRAFTVKQTGKQGIRPKLAIEYVAEYNIGTTPGQFATSHDNDKSGYYGFDAAKQASMMPAGYHLPSQEEWTGIVPYYAEVAYSDPINRDKISEFITIKGVRNVYTSDYHNKGNGICYALRFKNGSDKSMLCAYRYERVGPMSVINNRTDHLKVTVRYLGDSFTGSIATIETEDFWKNNAGNDVTRIFPACGRQEKAGNSGTLGLRGTFGFYWSSYEFSRTNGWNMYFSADYASAFYFYTEGYGLTVRPFSNE